MADEQRTVSESQLPNTKSLPQRWRKQPVEIWAYQYNGLNAAEIEEWALSFTPDEYYRPMRMSETGALYIRTMEGVMNVSKNDFVIRGVEGEFYACKPTIFRKTYTEVITAAKTSPEATSGLQENAPKPPSSQAREKQS